MNGHSMLPLPSERGNTWTHLAGTLFALSSIWMIWPSVKLGWQMAMGVAFFITGMFLMFLSSTVYHWLHPGLAKNILRKCDHISIYVMIACSYTPICIGVVGGTLGWTAFALQWAMVAAGAYFKVQCLGRYPRLSLLAYLVMGWSIVFIAKPVLDGLTPLQPSLLLADGIFYSAGTYFYAHDSRPHFHAVWHVFVMLGAMAHWSAILAIVLGT